MEPKQLDGGVQAVHKGRVRAKGSCSLAQPHVAVVSQVLRNQSS